MQDAEMGRRSSGSNTTRLLQGLFALAWIVFLCYMISGYLGRQDDPEVAGGGDAATTEPTGDPLSTAATADNTLNLTAPDTNADVGNANSVGPTGSEILQNVISAYKSAKSYSDNGQLVMSSEIFSQPYKEPYPWKTTWKNDGRLSADIFYTAIRSDGQQLSCFVSDIKSRNLEDQQLFLKGPNLLGQLYRDGIANYYLNGGERIPVNEAVVPNGTKLVPPALAILTGETMSPWFGGNARVTRIADGLVKKIPEDPASTEQFPCYVIQIESINGTMTAWVDKQNSIIRQLQFPQEILDLETRTDPNVKNLKLMARFDGAKFDATDIAFEKVYPRNANVWPVSQFVVPSKPLPTNLLGESAPNFQLSDAKRRSVSDRDFSGRTTVMLWVDGGEYDSKLISGFKQVESETTANEVEFVVVAGNDAIQKSENGSWVLSSEIQPAANRTKLPFLADLNGEATEKFEFESLPAVAVLDRNLNIQFADQLAKPVGYNAKPGINKHWDSKLLTAVSVIHSGKNLADDMLVQYTDHLTQYFDEKQKYLVADRFPNFNFKGKSRVVAVPANVRREKETPKLKLQLNPKLVWKSNQLELPGYVATIPDSRGMAKGLLILDGWQTITMFGIDGKLKGRSKLSLPPNTAVSAIRPVNSKTGEQLFAMFSVGGKQVFVFDQSMKLVARYPESISSRNSILACEIVPAGSGKNDLLLVCFDGEKGGELLDPFSGKAKLAGERTISSVAISGRKVVAVDGRSGSLVSMENGRAIETRRQYVHVESGTTGTTDFAATAMNSNREWSLVGVGADLKEKWTFAISRALLENNVEPISGIATKDGKGTWAVVDSTNRIFLLSDSGAWLGDMAADGNVRGLELVSVNGRTQLIVSTEKLVECWELNFTPDRVGSIGERR